MGVDYGLGRRFSVGLGIGDLAVLFEDSERDDEHSPTLRGSTRRPDPSRSRHSVERGAGSLDRYTNAEEDGPLATETELVTSTVRSLSPVSALVAGVGLSLSNFIDAARTDHDMIARLGYSWILVRTSLDVGYRYGQR